MLKNLYLVCGVVALALGCSGTSTEPNTFTGGGVLWNPEAGDLAVNTAVYATTWPKGAVENGHWFWEVQTDVEDGGLSMIEWPVAPGDGADPLAPIIETCSGICGTAVLKTGDLYYHPFVSLGFVLANNENGESVPVDVSNWGGICVSYSSDASPTLELDLGEEVNESLGYGQPAAALPKTYDGAVVSKCLSWDDFLIPSWARANVPAYWKGNAGAKAAKQLVAVRFKFQAIEGGYKFNIKSVRTLSGVSFDYGYLEPPVDDSEDHRGSIGGDGDKTDSVDVKRRSGDLVYEALDSVLDSLLSGMTGDETEGPWFWSMDDEALYLKHNFEDDEPDASVRLFQLKDGVEKPVSVENLNWEEMCLAYKSKEFLTLKFNLNRMPKNLLGDRTSITLPIGQFGKDNCVSSDDLPVMLSSLLQSSK